MKYYWSYMNKDTGEIGESAYPYTTEKRAKASVLAHIRLLGLKRKDVTIKVTTEPYPYSSRGGTFK